MADAGAAGMTEFSHSSVGIDTRRREEKKRKEKKPTRSGFGPQKHSTASV